MKIVDVVCSAGRTGFYFDDQRAIKKELDMMDSLMLEKL